MGENKHGSTQQTFFFEKPQQIHFTGSYMHTGCCTMSDVTFSLHGANLTILSCMTQQNLAMLIGGYTHTCMMQQFSAVLVELISDNVYLILFIKMCLMAQKLKATGVG
jgi:hypothetical protein